MLTEAKVLDLPQIPPQFTIIQDEHLVVRKTVEVKRSWKERLFSWPWRPWKKTKLVDEYHPDPNFYILGSFTFTCHPALYNQLRKQLESQNPIFYKAAEFSRMHWFPTPEMGGLPVGLHAGQPRPDQRQNALYRKDGK
jgi:hypothetical protein